MNVRWTNWLAVSLWTVAALVATCVLVVEYANGGLVDWLFPEGYVAAILGIMALSSIGALLAIHRPANAIGWIALVAGISLGILGLANGYAEYSTVTNPDGAPGIPVLLWLGAWVWVPAYFVLPSIGILIFPTGRLPSQRWQWFAWLVGGLLVLMAVAEMFAPGPLLEPDEYPEIMNPVGIEPLSSPLNRIVNNADLLIIPILGGPIISILARLRGASTIERQQIKWFAYAAIVPVVGLILYFILFALPTVENATAGRIGEYIILMGVALLPVAIGIAILRHNLYDIDRLINRTLVYGLQSLLLVLGFAGSIILFQILLSPFTRGNDLAVAGSTLLVFALFRPLRDRLQRFVDRSFYREKYDARSTLERFSFASRNAVDLDQITSELTRLLSSTMQPEHLSVWLRRSQQEAEE